MSTTTRKEKTPSYFVWTLEQKEGYLLLLDYPTKSSYAKENNLLVKKGWEYVGGRDCLSSVWKPLTKEEFLLAVVGGLSYIEEQYGRSSETHSLSGVS